MPQTLTSAGAFCSAWWMLMYCADQMAFTVDSMACLSGAATMTSADHLAASISLSGVGHFLHKADFIGSLCAHPLETSHQRQVA